ncbi:MAG: hypothetical protein E7160_02290 [Firmicutes bacterium]|nr:hypothetical protein [Bacillota bacterium]
MNIEKLFILDPNNSEHIKLFDNFNKSNNIDNNIVDLLSNNKSDNVIKECLFLEEKGELKDYCFIYAEKDRKAATLEFANIEKTTGKRKIINMAKDYSFNALNMQLVVIVTEPTNKNLIANLAELEFENLGEDNGKLVFMKENELEKEQGMIRHGNN